jgi:uncharacterized protein
MTPVLLIDVNVLVLSFWPDLQGASGVREWLTGVANSSEAYCVPDASWSGFIRIVTNPRIFREPAAISEALDLVEVLRGRPNHVPLAPGAGYWPIFVQLCRDADVRADLVPDAYLAALAIETGSELITADRGFGRYPGLRWRHPLSERA